MLYFNIVRCLWAPLLKTFSPAMSRGLWPSNHTSCIATHLNAPMLTFLSTIDYRIPFVPHYNFISPYTLRLCAVLSSLLGNSIFKWFVFIKCHQDLLPKTQRLQNMHFDFYLNRRSIAFTKVLKEATGHWLWHPPICAYTELHGLES